MVAKKIFISYRRTDSEYIAGRIYQYLSKTFGAEAVFFDICGGITDGADFRTALNEAVGQCRVMLVVVGGTWQSVRNKQGFRLHQVDDWVRLEVEAGLGRDDCVVIPLMLDNGKLDEDKLPDSLQPLVYRQYRKVRNDPDFENDMEALVKNLVKGYGLEPLDEPIAPEDSGQRTGDIGGSYVGGDVNTGGGDFVGRDKNVTAGNRGIAIGGNVSGSTLITGDHNVVNSAQIAYREELIKEVCRKIEQAPDLSSEDKSDLKSEVQEIDEEDQDGKKDEGWFAKRLRNIKRMSPDIAEVVMMSVLDPKAGFGGALQKVAAKMKAEQG